MKKLILLMLGGLSTLTTLAHDFYYEYEGQTVIYTVLDENAKTCETKKGSGSRSVVYADNNHLSGDLVIPAVAKDGETEYTVISIADYSFAYTPGISFELSTSNYKGLTSITIPNTITTIGEYAFNGCSGLTAVNISDLAAWCKIDFGRMDSNPLNLAHRLYLNGEEIKDLVLPNSVTSINDNVFSGCTGLTSLSIPNSVTSIGDYAFNACYNLTAVNISDLESWCNIIFGSQYSNPLIYAEHLFLNGEEITNLIIPESISEIGSNTFDGCKGLTHLVLNSSVHSIGYMAFYGCSGLVSVLIPSSVNSIGTYAFVECPELTSVYYSADEPKEFDDIVFDTETYGKATLFVPEVAIEKCKVINPWKNFNNVQAYEFNGIDDVLADFDRERPYEVYNLNGIKVADSTEGLNSGIYIVRQGSSVKKIAVK